MAGIFLCLHNLSAEVVYIPPGGPDACITIPRRWAVKVEGEMTHAISPEERVHFVIVPIESRKVGEAMGEVMKYIRNAGGIVVSAPTMRKDRGRVSGREATFISWQGRDKGGPVEIHYVVLTFSPNESFLASYWGAPDALRAHRYVLGQMLKSIAPRD